MLATDSRPLCLSFAFRDDDEFVINGLGGSLAFQGESDLLQDILRHCHGFLTVEEIARICGVDGAAVLAELQPLVERTVVVDAFAAWAHLHVLSSNPQILSPAGPERGGDAPPALHRTGPLGDRPISGQRPRHTSREFGGKPISKHQVERLLTTAYGDQPYNRVPSAGAIYPISIRAVCLSDRHGMPAGVYQFQERREMVRVSDAPLSEYLAAAAGDSLFGAEVITTLVLAANIDKMAYRYGNRGYRYALIEVGHVAQQLQLASADEGLGILEFGGFFDRRLQELLNLGSDLPLLVLAIGRPGDQVRSDSITRTLDADDERSHGQAQGNEWIFAPSDEQPLVRSRVEFRLPSGEEAVGLGADVSLKVASEVAWNEARERGACSVPRIDWFGSAAELDVSWLDPRIAFPLSRAQLARFGLAAFTPTTELSWARGMHWISGEPCFVPTDYVSFVVGDDVEHRLYMATSSGVACDANLGVAEERAVLELVERDAIVRAWLSADPIPRVAPDAVDEFTADRRHFWSRTGDLQLACLPSEFAHCVLACIFSEKWPYFACGAAASLDIATAARRAVVEAESTRMEVVRVGDGGAIRIGDVMTPFDHCMYWSAAAQRNRLAWLREGRASADHEPRSRHHLEATDPVMCRLSEEGDEPVVVRAIAESLVPINFGAYFVHGAHHRVRGSVKNRHAVHCFG